MTTSGPEQLSVPRAGVGPGVTSINPALPLPAASAPLLPATAAEATTAADVTKFKVLGAVSFAHLLNDMMQSVVVALYPLLKQDFALSFTQIGLITLTYQLTASLLQPLIGHHTDRYAKPYSLPVGMGFTLTGVLLLSVAWNFGALLVGSALVGTGSAVFHPESSRVARMASGGRHGFAQSFFQVGGNLGGALGPLLAATFVMPFGQRYISLFSPLALVAIVVLLQVSKWYAAQHRRTLTSGVQLARPTPDGRVYLALSLLLVLLFSKFFYSASLGNYFTFYLMERFHIAPESAQLYLFAFLFASALGTLVGGPVGDRVGRKVVIWGSVLGAAPLALLLPHASLFWTGVLVVTIGMVLSSAFSAMLVYAQELIPGRVGLVSGLFFGLAFGMAGVGAALLGVLADRTSVTFVYQVCALLPLLGVAGLFLPDLRQQKQPAR